MGKDSLSSKEDPKPQLDNVLKLLLATISILLFQFRNRPGQL